MRPGLIGGGIPPSTTSETIFPPPPVVETYLALEDGYLLLQEDGSYIETE